MREHLVFRGQFVSADELRQYLQAADIFVSPYLNEAQVTSGALSYAMGAGAAVVSTPYWHAQELLSGGRGRLFPFKDHAALGRTLLELFGSPAELRRVRDAAFAFAQSMAWPRIGDAYFEIIGHTLRSFRAAACAGRICGEPRAREQLAGAVPRSLAANDRRHRHHPARHLQRAGAAHRLLRRRQRARADRRRARRSLAGLGRHARARHHVLELSARLAGAGRQLSQLHELRARARSRRRRRTIASAARSGRSALPPSSPQTRVAACSRATCSTRALPHARELGPRGTAQAMLGLVSVLAVEPGADRRCAACSTPWWQSSRSAIATNATDDWRWFEPTLTYDNAMLPLALFAAYGVTGDRATLRDARESLEFLEEVCFDGDQLQLVGNTGWHSSRRRESRAPTSRPSMRPPSCSRSAALTRPRKIRHYLRRMREAFAWFLGANRLGLPLYDFATGGCRDGMGVAHVNQNQGAESTICFLHVAAQDARTGRRRARTRADTPRHPPTPHEIHPDQTHAASAAAGRPPRARQAVSSRRRDASCRDSRARTC